jgi:UDP-N-acetylglucosamine diphosphorylase/glucosamine-1-phosphate N-acetyltransferase
MTIDGLVLFDDRRAQGWEPFAATRPVAFLRFGAWRLASRAQAALDRPLMAVLAPDRLQGLEEPGMPRVTALGDPPSQGRRIFLSSRAVPQPLDPDRLPMEASLTIGGRLVGWVVPDGQVPPLESLGGAPGGGAARAGASEFDDPLSFPGQGPSVEIEGEILDWPWSLMERNADRLAADLAEDSDFPSDPSALDQVVVLGSHPVSLGAKVEIEPGVVIDVRDGPVRLEDGVRLCAFTRLTGPALVGAGTTLLGGDVGRVTIGRAGKIRGEVADSVIDDFVNKAHDGHLGHAVVGRWVNLGAGTTNSDLKNSYGSVRVETGTGTLDTGHLKVGAFLGDHVKTGIGTLLPTGAVAGAGANIFGGGMAPGYTPAVTWRGPEGPVPYDLDRFLTVARRVMARRQETLSGGEEQVLRRVWMEAQGE